MSDSVAGKVPVVAVWRDAWLFLFRNWRTFVPAALAMASISQIGPAATLMLGGGAASGLSFVIAIPMIIAGLMFTGAVLRKAVRDEFIAPIGMTLGPDEGRLLGVGVSVTLLAIPIFALLFIALSATVLRSMAASPEAMEALAADPEAMMQAVVEALGVGGLTLLTIVLVTLVSIAMGLVALADAATIGERRIMVFQAWSWLKGNTLRVLGVMILTAAPIMVINTIVSEVLATAFLSVTGGAVSLLPYLLLLTLIAFMNAIVSIPVAALGAILYKGLRPPERAAQ